MMLSIIAAIDKNYVKLVSKRIMGKAEPDQWNVATKDQLYQRDKLIQKIENYCEIGNFDSIESLLSKV